MVLRFGVILCSSWKLLWQFISKKNGSPFFFLSFFLSKPQERDVIYNNFISFLVSVNHCLLFRRMTLNAYGK